MSSPLKIIGSGHYLPRKIFTAQELDRKLDLSEGTSFRTSGVRQRHYVQEDETQSFMGARAIMAALENAHLSYESLDLILCASGSSEQTIPCTAALIQRELGKSESGTPCFDINSTCLSFVSAMDLAASLLTTRRYRKIAIVSTEIASVGLNYSHLESASLFGDGAAAFIVERTPAGENSALHFAHMETFSSGAEYCKIEGGGTKLHPGKTDWKNVDHEKFLFTMDGRRVFREVLSRVPVFIEHALKPHNKKLTDFDWIIPHQASASGMQLVKKKLEIPTEKFVDILENHGNMIAASIPLALHLKIQDGTIRRGQSVCLFGTSAGLSIGMVTLEY